MTNQASEDELVRKAILKILHQTESCTGCKDHYKKPHKCDMDLAAPRCVKRVRKLEALIRTEKLKLLDRLHHEYYEVDEETLDTLIEAERNKLKEVK